MNKKHMFHSIVFHRAAVAACSALVYFGAPVKLTQSQAVSNSSLPIAYSFFSKSEMQKQATAYLTANLDGQPVLITHRSTSDAFPTKDASLVSVHLGEDVPNAEKVIFDREGYAAGNRKAVLVDTASSSKRPETSPGKPAGSEPGSVT